MNVITWNGKEVDIPEDMVGRFYEVQGMNANYHRKMNEAVEQRIKNIKLAKEKRIDFDINDNLGFFNEEEMKRIKEAINE